MGDAAEVVIEDAEDDSQDDRFSEEQKPHNDEDSKEDGCATWEEGKHGDGDEGSNDQGSHDWERGGQEEREDCDDRAFGPSDPKYARGGSTQTPMPTSAPAQLFPEHVHGYGSHSKPISAPYAVVLDPVTQQFVAVPPSFHPHPPPPPPQFSHYPPGHPVYPPPHPPQRELQQPSPSTQPPHHQQQQQHQQTIPQQPQQQPPHPPPYPPPSTHLENHPNYYSVLRYPQNLFAHTAWAEYPPQLTHRPHPPHPPHVPLAANRPVRPPNSNKISPRKAQSRGGVGPASRRGPVDLSFQPGDYTGYRQHVNRSLKQYLEKPKVKKEASHRSARLQSNLQQSTSSRKDKPDEKRVNCRSARTSRRNSDGAANPLLLSMEEMEDILRPEPLTTKAQRVQRMLTWKESAPRRKSTKAAKSSTRRASARTERSFMRRVAAYTAKYVENRRSWAHQAANQLDPECTFHPVVSARKAPDGKSFQERMRRDGEMRRRKEPAASDARKPTSGGSTVADEGTESRSNRGVFRQFLQRMRDVEEQKQAKIEEKQAEYLSQLPFKPDLNGAAAGLLVDKPFMQRYREDLEQVLHTPFVRMVDTVHINYHARLYVPVACPSHSASPPFQRRLKREEDERKARKPTTAELVAKLEQEGGGSLPVDFMERYQEDIEGRKARKRANEEAKLQQIMEDAVPIKRTPEQEAMSQWVTAVRGDFEKRLGDDIQKRRQPKNPGAQYEDKELYPFVPETNWGYYTLPDANGQQRLQPRWKVRLSKDDEQAVTDRLYKDAMRRVDKDVSRDKYFELDKTKNRPGELGEVMFFPHAARTGTNDDIGKFSFEKMAQRAELPKKK